MLQAVFKVNPHIVLVLMNGRPLDLSWEDANIPAIVEGWFLGNQAGNALADVIFGNYNPTAKLAVSFPRNVGQIPIFYSHLNSGRPQPPGDTTTKYVSRYLDVDNSPLYPFGFGLSYSKFSYSNISLDKSKMSNEEEIQVQVNVTNSGTVDGYEIVQLYIRDMVASISRPVQELKDFQKVLVKA